MVQTTRLQLPLIAAAQAQKHVTHNEAVLRLDGLVQMTAKSYTASAQPASPADGDLYLLPAGKTGTDWGGYANHAAAHYYDGIWHSYAPQTGWLSWVQDSGILYSYTGAQWTPVPLPNSIADGSVSAPGLAFASDANTGLYRIGADNLGIAAGGTKLEDIKATGITRPLQPAFLAYLSASQANKTGDGTAYDVPFDSETFDRGSNHDAVTSKGVFTAPVTGLYLFGSLVRLSGLLAAHTQWEMQFVATGGTYVPLSFDPHNIIAGGILFYSASQFVPMTAGDTCKLRIAVYNGTKVVQIDGGSSTNKTNFWGFLVA